MITCKTRRMHDQAMHDSSDSGLDMLNAGSKKYSQDA